MTIEELTEAYHSAYSDCLIGTEDGLRARRAGVTAIVRALRDEIADAYERGFDDATSEDWGSPRKHRSNYACAESIINEILGDAGEKVAGTETTAESLQGRVPATDPIRDAAPAVCVWTLTNWTPDDSWYRTSHGERTRAYSSLGKCIACGLPIKFTEVK